MKFNIAKDLSNSFNPYPKVKTEKKKTETKIKQKSNKLAKKERNRFSILTKDLEHCYIWNAKKEDLHELIGGRNRQTSMRYGLVIPLCRKCHEMIEKDETLKREWRKVAQKEFKNYYKSENFVQIFGKNYL